MNSFLERVYSPDRIMYPFRRVGPKGEGAFERITWNDALTEISTRFHCIIAVHGAQAIMPYVGAGNQGLLALMFGDRFWHHPGATRVVGSCAVQPPPPARPPPTATATASTPAR